GPHAVDLRRHRGRLCAPRRDRLAHARWARHRRAAGGGRRHRSRFDSRPVRSKIVKVTGMIEHASLRERKKARTRDSIREHALRLFRDQGYQTTTVEQIAAAAEVSPSTFFRYFPTKEDVVLQDDMDIRLVEAFARQPGDLAPLPAVRAAVREAWASFTDTE